MQSQLSFGEDCVIRLEDLGEFKDYTETLETLKQSLSAVSNGQLAHAPNELWEIIDSDPEDTFFLPDFQGVLTLMSSIDWHPMVTQDQNLKIIRFYLQIIEEAFLSFTFSEEIVESVTKQILKSQSEGLQIQQILLKLMFRLSDKVMYIEEINKLGVFWEMINEKQLFTSFGEGNSDKIGAVYAECCEKFLRNRQFRKIVTYSNERPFLSLKLAVWQRNKPNFTQLSSLLQSTNFHSSSFLKESQLHLIPSLELQ